LRICVITGAAMHASFTCREENQMRSLASV